MLKKINKLILILIEFSPLALRGLFQGIYVSVEHKSFLKNNNYDFVVDIGANRGQFALSCRLWCPSASIISIEPLAIPAKKFIRFFNNDSKVKLHVGAVGADYSTSVIHISSRDDSSSLLDISELQVENFPGTKESSTSEVDVAPLAHYLNEAQISGKSLLKIDVQGFEYDVLVGSETLLHKFHHIYCECSFIELYTGQKFAHQIIEFLNKRNFIFSGIYNTHYDHYGVAIQGDMFFINSKFAIDCV
jgi:FkbM family methyltransferase